MPLRGEVWIVDLKPVKGSEQDKVRPCVVLSNDVVNTKLGISIVVPLTSQPNYGRSGKLSPALVEISPPEGGVLNTSYSMAHQVRTVSHNRFRKQTGVVSESTLRKIVVSVQQIIE